MEPVLQKSLPFAPWADARAWRLPGTRAAEADDWVRIDEAYAGQMAVRDRLLTDQRGDVLALMPEAREAADELLRLAITRAQGIDGFRVAPSTVVRPDGVRVSIDHGDPLGTLGHLFQEDFCLLQKPPGSAEHQLMGAVLCFPAGWTLTEKIGQPLGRIHRPVPPYGDVAGRVQRMLDGLKPGRPIWRANAHFYDEPGLYAPRAEADPRQMEVEGRYVRSEYQVLFRLPESRAIVFSIHTYVVSRDALAPEAEAALAKRPLTSGQ